MTIATPWGHSGPSRNIEEFYGQTIAASRFEGEKLVIDFSNGATIAIYDDGQDCCEYRYMTCDDDIQTLVGGRLVNVTVKDGPYEDEDEGEVHEQQFLEIQTTRGFVTIANHNEHNGYYGGFSLAFDVRKKGRADTIEISDVPTDAATVQTELNGMPVCVDINKLIAEAEIDIDLAAHAGIADITPLISRVIERQRDFLNFYMHATLTRH